MPVPQTFRLVVVPGVTVDRWSRTWSERLPAVNLQLVPAEATHAAALIVERADAGLIRLPVDQETYHAIPLYTETTVVVVPRDQVLAAADELTLADLADEMLLQPQDDVLTWADWPTMSADRPVTTAIAVERVAAGGGVVVVPQSLARLHHRRDLTYRAVTDAPTSTVALVWLRDRHTDLVEDMIGIVRGRTANSTRGRGQPVRTPNGVPRDGAKSRRSPRRRGR